MILALAWWQWLLLIVAGFLLAIFIVLTAVLLWARAKWRAFKDSIGGLADAMGKPAIPQTLEMRAADPAELEKRPALRKALGELRSLGFETGGVFETEGLKQTVAVPFADTTRRVSGLAVESPRHGVVLDFVTVYADGRAITHTNLPDQGLEGPPQRPKVRLVGAGAAAMLERHLAERPEGDSVAVAVAEVPALVKRFTEEEWFWRATRGGATDAELERQVQLARAEAPESFEGPKSARMAALMTRALIRGQATAFIQEKLLEQFQRETTMSVHEWERIEDRLVFVHDAADPRELGRHVAHPDESRPGAGDGEESDWADGMDPPLTPTQQRLHDGPAREVFAELNASLPLERRLEQVGTVTISSTLASLTADIYVAPAEPEEIEDDDE